MSSMIFFPPLKSDGLLKWPLNFFEQCMLQWQKIKKRISWFSESFLKAVDDAECDDVQSPAWPWSRPTHTRLDIWLWHVPVWFTTYCFQYQVPDRESHFTNRFTSQHDSTAPCVRLYAAGYLLFQFNCISGLIVKGDCICFAHCLFCKINIPGVCSKDTRAVLFLWRIHDNC